MLFKYFHSVIAAVDIIVTIAQGTWGCTTFIDYICEFSREICFPDGLVLSTCLVQSLQQQLLLYILHLSRIALSRRILAQVMRHIHHKNIILLLCCDSHASWSILSPILSMEDDNFDYIQWVLSLDMKTKVAKHVPRIKKMTFTKCKMTFTQCKMTSNRWKMTFTHWKMTPKRWKMTSLPIFNEFWA